jgi:hypothetical protein
MIKDSCYKTGINYSDTASAVIIRGNGDCITGAEGIIIQYAIEWQKNLRKIVKNKNTYLKYLRNIFLIPLNTQIAPQSYD